MSSNMEDLHPIMRLKAELLILRCQSRNIKLLVYFTFRTDEEQDKLYLIGRRGIEGEETVTDAKGGGSAHNWRAAFDCVPLKDGKPQWDAPDSVWKIVWEEAEEVGLDTLADKWGEYMPKDKGHMQEPGWKYIKKYLLAG